MGVPGTSGLAGTASGGIVSDGMAGCCMAGGVWLSSAGILVSAMAGVRPMNRPMAVQVRRCFMASPLVVAVKQARNAPQKWGDEVLAPPFHNNVATDSIVPREPAKAAFVGASIRAFWRPSQ